jgi:alpha,alpha-trehalase
MENKVDSLITVAQDLAERYVESGFCGWWATGGTIPGYISNLGHSTDTGHMFEKFNVTVIGRSGGGGEVSCRKYNCRLGIRI